jgi:7-keto-8-aminopelargonate synthetase-like enzyme
MEDSPLEIAGPAGRIVKVRGKEYLFFSGFAYLDMSSLEGFRALVREGMETYGLTFPSSRLSNTRLWLYDQFESRLSAFTGQQASASFSSGYMAAQAAISHALGDSVVLYAPGIHPALRIRGSDARMIPTEQWPSGALKAVNQSSSVYHTVALESVDPLTGRVSDFSWMEQLRHPVRILVDDSHGIGLLGEQGQGVSTLLPVHSGLSYLLTYSLSKAFGCEGGAVSGTDVDIMQIKKTPQFTAATAMSPAFAYAWMNGEVLFTRQLARLRQNIRSLTEALPPGIPLEHDPRLPVYYVRDPEFYPYCLSQNILLSAFRYPSETDPPTVRIVLNASHRPQDLEWLVDAIQGYFLKEK